METLYNGVQAFSGNYSNVDFNFVIQNLPGNVKEHDVFYPSICVLENILMRGEPSRASEFLVKSLELSQNPFTVPEKISLSSNAPNRWIHTIKGDDRHGYYAAQEFYDDILQQFNEDYPGIQQLFFPEAYILDISEIYNENFQNQQVDFYCDIANLVLELDGSQHAERIQAILDQERMDFLRKSRIDTIRIKNIDMHTKSSSFQNSLLEIKSKLGAYSGYNWMLEENAETASPEEKRALLLTAVFRFQILILELLKAERISLRDNSWHFAIKEGAIRNFEELALGDIFLWLKNLLKLRNLEFRKPRIEISVIGQEESFAGHENDICIDFSIFKTWSDENVTSQGVIYVRNAYRQKKNYFRISKAEPIKYCINETAIDEKGIFHTPVALTFLLKNIFGHKSFREGQAEIIANALGLNDTIGLLPTGSGKSACYQLSALLQPCVSLCVAPIKSLMYDQVENLRSANITRVNLITSDIMGRDREVIQDCFAKGEYFWLFISPERFQSPEFRNELDALNKVRNIQFAYAVIDEAHCLSEWGHNFRTSYLNLVKTIKSYTPTAVLLGLTATASVNTLKNIQIEFGVNDRRNVITCGSYTRKELAFDVLRTEDGNKYQLLKNKINDYKNAFSDLLKNVGSESRCGIIFTPYVNGLDGCYRLSNRISKDFNAKVEWYAGAQPKGVHMAENVFNAYKLTTQQNFKENIFTLLVATKAFGMGIDKPNIRYTIHYGLPSSLEALYQEAGRAGRDRKKAQCTVIMEPEYEEEKDALDKLFSKDITVEGLEYLCNEACPPPKTDEWGRKQYTEWRGKDVYKQFLLMINSIQRKQDDVLIAEAIMNECPGPGAENVLFIPWRMSRRIGKKVSCQMLEKVLYHLSLVGVVEDWTLSGMRDDSTKISVYFSYFGDASIAKSLENAIKNYEPDFSLEGKRTRNNNLKYCMMWKDETYTNTAIRAFSVYWEWYYDNIFYNRRQALKTVKELCESYDDSNPAQFKQRMESYFSYSTATDIFEKILLDGNDESHWFEVLNAKFILEQGVQNLIMQLGRFLESSRNNTGFNYVSGILRLIAGTFDNIDGKARLESAIRDFASNGSNKWKEIFDTTCEFLSGILEDDEKELLSEAYINSVDEDDADVYIYKKLEDNYSLHVIMNQGMSKMYKCGKEYGIW